MLAQTHGLLPTDNFEFLADFNPRKDLTFITEIAGLNKLKLSSDNLSVGDQLNYQLERDNKYDKFAVKLLKDGKYVGYVKLIHSRVFYRAKSKLKVTVHHLEKNGVISRAFIEVKI